MKLKQSLIKLKQELEDIAGEWDGKEAGLKEERAQIAREAIIHVIKLILLLDELKDPFNDEEHNELLDEKLNQEYMDDRKTDIEEDNRTQKLL